MGRGRLSVERGRQWQGALASRPTRTATSPRLEAALVCALARNRANSDARSGWRRRLHACRRRHPKARAQVSAPGGCTCRVMSLGVEVRGAEVTDTRGTVGGRVGGRVEEDPSRGPSGPPA
eukprot:3280579-Rhodomonas_salina.1